MTMSLPAGLLERIPALTGKKRAAVQYGPVGLDFDSSGIRLIQFRNTGSRIELSASAHVPLSVQARGSAKKTGALVRKALRQNGFVGRDVVSCLPPKDVKIIMISFLHQAGKRDEELILQRVAERIEGDITDYVIDFLMIRPQVKDGQERSVLVAMARRDRVMDYLEYLRKAGLKTRVLEIEPTAIRRLVLLKHGNDHTSNLMMVSMGDSQTYITVLSGRRLIYERDVGFGERQLIELLCRELELNEPDARTMLVGQDNVDMAIDESGQSMSMTDALYGVLKPLFMELVEDINRALVYAASETRGMPVEHVYLTNVVARWRGIENFIDSLIDVPVSVLVPFEGFGNKGGRTTESDPCSAVVTGMALHGLTEAG